MRVEGSVALVTGAGRGLGATLAGALLDAGAAKVYATARDVARITDPRLTPLRLDITDRASITAAAEAASDVTLVINNAGIATGTGILGAEERLREELEVNYLGPLAVARAFAPVLGTNGGGALVNVLSVLAWRSITGSGGYSAAKAAMWSATNSLRLDLREQGTVVTGVLMGYVDTDMTEGIDAPKSAPRTIAALTIAGIEAGDYEVIGDELTRQVRAGLAAPITAAYPILAA
jgi:NAD(P)-dependent dehydrogenase (short-subunit alcohol dehydrogenase family)